MKAESNFLLEKQKTEYQAKMLQIQGQSKQGLDWRLFEDCNQMEVSSEIDEVESGKYEEKVQQRWRYKGQRQENLRANVDDNKSYVKVVLLDEGRSNAIRSDAVEYGHLPDKNQPDMVAMMSKLLWQQASLDVDSNIFNDDPVDYHYFIAVFNEVVEKKIDDLWGRLRKLINKKKADDL